MIKIKTFQDSKTLECIVFGISKRTICNFSKECKDCQKYKEAKRKRLVE